MQQDARALRLFFYDYTNTPHVRVEAPLRLY